MHPENQMTTSKSATPEEKGLRPGSGQTDLTRDDLRQIKGFAQTRSMSSTTWYEINATDVFRVLCIKKDSQ